LKVDQQPIVVLHQRVTGNTDSSAEPYFVLTLTCETAAPSTLG
jgi:hypothetical protein